MENKKPIRAVIFDLDGTLIDSEENYYLADKKLLKQYDIPFSVEDKKKYIGSGNREMMIDLKKRFSLPESVEELVKMKNDFYLEIAEKNTRLYPKMKSFLDSLHSQGYLTAIASGSSPLIISRLVDALHLRSFFNIIISAEEVGRGKPAPDIFIEAAKRLDVSAEESLVIEDSQYGVESAKRASMRCIAVPYLTEKPLAESFHRADLLFENGMEEFSAEKALAWIGSQQ
ncbi:MAG TPA: HAD family phosphatase [Spirochaetota bacterium]